MGTNENVGESEETGKCQCCGKRPIDRTEEKIIKETKQCRQCIERKEEIKGTNAKICHKCKNITYPLNTFKSEDGENDLCNECSIKESREGWETNDTTDKPKSIQ